MRRLSCVFAVILFVTASSSAQQPDLNQLKREAISEVDSLQTLTQQMVDEIFSYAELGFQEYNTSRYVSGILEKNGFTVQRGVAGIPTAWVGTKAFYIREGLFRDVDVVLGCHVGAAFDNHYGELGSGLVSVQYFFHGK